MDKISHRLKAERELGLVLQYTHPQIKDWYVGGLSSRVIAERIYSDRTFCARINYSGPVRTIEGGVRRALMGNSQFDARNRYEPFYEGFFDRRSYGRLSKKNRQKSAKRTHAENIENCKGALHLSREALSDAGKAANLARGLTLWTSEEIELASALKSLGYYHFQIMDKLNEQYHQDKSVRTKSAIDNLFKTKIKQGWAGK